MHRIDRALNRIRNLAVAACLLGAALVVPSSAKAEPVVVAQVGQTLMCTVNADRAANATQTWDLFWGLWANNDGLGDLEHPRVTLQDPVTFTGFSPNTAGIFTSQPAQGIYTWDFGSLEVPPGSGVAVHASYGSVDAHPGFSASRTVSPSRLGAGPTKQTITVYLKIERQFPTTPNTIAVVVGRPSLAFGGRALVKSEFVAQSQVSGWSSSGSTQSAGWIADGRGLEIEKWYRFSATLRTTRLHEIAGSPTFVPEVSIDAIESQSMSSIAGTVCPFSHAAGASGAFSASEPVEWHLGLFGGRRIFSLAQRVSPAVTSVTLKTSASSKSRRSNVTLSGTVTPYSGRTAQLQKRSGGTWKTLSRQAIKRGAFSFKRTERISGTATYKVHVSASTYAPAGSSRSVKVRWR
jgi:hypothetical protein